MQGCLRGGNRRVARHPFVAQQLVQPLARTPPPFGALLQKCVQRRLRKRAVEEACIAERCQVDDGIAACDADARAAIGRGKNPVG